MLYLRQHMHHLHATSPISAWLRSRSNSMGEILTFEAQRFDPVNMWYADGSKAVRDNGIGLHVGPFVLDFQHFSRITVVVHRHPDLTHYPHAPHFTSIQPPHFYILLLPFDTF